MPFPVTCPKCGSPGTVPSRAIGRSIKCPACGARFRAGGAEFAKPSLTRQLAGLAKVGIWFAASALVAFAFLADVQGNSGAQGFDSDLSKMRWAPMPVRMTFVLVPVYCAARALTFIVDGFAQILDPD